jgi:ribosomal protein S18 acetylase RimI-like enzyme
MDETHELLRLTARAMVVMSGAPDHEIILTGDGALALSGEPVADLNMGFIWPGAGAEAFLRMAAKRSAARALPLIVLLAPQVAPRLAPVAEDLGLALAGTTPLMVLRMADAPPPSRACEIRRADDETTGRIAGDLTSAAFGLPREVIARAWDVLMTPTAPIETFVAWGDGEPVSSVSVSRHGTTAGIWTMGTPPQRQGKGWGKALLTGVLHRLRGEGVDRVYLYASDAGFPLYRSIGFSTLADMPVWLHDPTDTAHGH